MKNESTEPNDVMRTDYDFRSAVRGRHYKPLHEGYTIEIHKADGTFERFLSKLPEDEQRAIAQEAERLMAEEMARRQSGKDQT